MGLPNATSILRTLPGGLSAVVSRTDNGDVATRAARTAITTGGQLAIGGIVATARENVWTLAEDFDPAIAPGDILSVDSVPAIVVDCMMTAGDLLNRAGVILCKDSATIGGTVYACNLGMIDGAGSGEGNFLPEFLRGLFIPGQYDAIEQGMELDIGGAKFDVETVRRDPVHNVTCVMYRVRQADA